MAETIKKLTETDDIAGKAEKIILGLKNDRLLGGTNGLTTNQIRKFLTAVNTLTNKITLYRHQQEQTRELSEDLAKEVRFLKVKLAYQVARGNKGVKQFAKDTQLKEYIDTVGTDLKEYMAFAQFIEALVAYHKFYGEKEGE
ncbi:type III-A CRISPR-associated protein Csm2 [Selenomonas sp. oral taxon 136]|uniref:type III-A CRISPR-associated protein Csm2 n=1 Tax=Selenomonas sp. oral taxon 136 TaxID=713030 RepID=UPI000768267E|nr:type III-A CRISPR-associated protein Csm2 [Selenomonas sp. oral taxon 136]AME03476.1 type III-A CRISPR-associated protein Csm2 [Selenomonas sp. oral taxon 136]